jgi:hypothetical protein
MNPHAQFLKKGPVPLRKRKRARELREGEDLETAAKEDAHNDETAQNDDTTAQNEDADVFFASGHENVSAYPPLLAPTPPSVEVASPLGAFDPGSGDSGPEQDLCCDDDEAEAPESNPRKHAQPKNRGLNPTENRGLTPTPAAAGSPPPPLQSKAPPENQRNPKTVASPPPKTVASPPPPLLSAENKKIKKAVYDKERAPKRNEMQKAQRRRKAAGLPPPPKPTAQELLEKKVESKRKRAARDKARAASKVMAKLGSI